MNGRSSRDKGKLGERQIAVLLNSVVHEVRRDLGLPALLKRDEPFQRNQNQSAVGGDDLTNPFGLSIEVKRQESLSVNSWWQQALKSAERSDGIPILIYKQNHKKWRVVMQHYLFINNSDALTTAAEIDIETFLEWFRRYYAAGFDKK